MRIVTDLPRSVRIIRHTWIPMADGCRLAARVWLPEDAEADPVPAVLEYIPYRKNDGTATRDAPMHAYFAGHGYAAVRVDMRGSGDSDGILQDEYLPLEQQDALEVLHWLATQTWCTGRVGIIGKSWGGFNALQIAAHDPPELGAVISVASTDDRYADDVHYMGGCLLAWEMLSWASTMLAYNARPPDPEVVGESWRQRWLERMAQTPPFVEAWVAHQRRDEFWKQGSVCEDYAAIRCPVYMVGGWADAYRNAILRFLEGYPGQAKGLIGPWGHLYPQDGVPGPAIGFLQEAVRWWDYTLKGIDNGIMEEPRLRVWMQDSVRPASHYPQRPGRWLTDPTWPSPNVAVRWLALGRGTLGGDAEATRLELRGVQAPASDPGVWCAHGEPTDFPADQRAEDGQSLVFDSEPLQEPVQILGFPEARIELACDRPLALVAVRLCDVWPDGASTLITRGLLNLAHRAGHERPAPLEPGQRYTVNVRLGATGWALPPGHCLRVAISPTYWPCAWPSPAPVTLSVFVGGESALSLPVRAPAGELDSPPPFAEPESAPPLQTEPLTPCSAGFRQTRRDVAAQTVTITNDFGHSPSARLLDSGIEYVEWGRDTFRIVDAEPLSASVEAERRIAIGRGNWRTHVKTLSTMSATADEFLLTNELDAFEADQRVFSQTWHTTIPRDHV